jgi:hypothetical protein
MWATNRYASLQAMPWDISTIPAAIASAVLPADPYLTHPYLLSSLSLAGSILLSIGLVLLLKKSASGVVKVCGLVVLAAPEIRTKSVSRASSILTAAAPVVAVTGCSQWHGQQHGSTAVRCKQPHALNHQQCVLFSKPQASICGHVLLGLVYSADALDKGARVLPACMLCLTAAAVYLLWCMKKQVSVTGGADRASASGARKRGSTLPTQGLWHR